MKPRLQVVSVKFALDELSIALRLPENIVQSALRDGRGAWPFTEAWGERVFEYATHANTNEAFSDGLVSLKRLGNMNVSVKALTGGRLKFQQSKFVGSGRSGDKSDLTASLEACDRVVVVDIRAFPLVEFYPLDVPRLLSAAHNGVLNTNGWWGAQFEDWVGRTYDVDRLVVEL